MLLLKNQAYCIKNYAYIISVFSDCFISAYNLISAKCAKNRNNNVQCAHVVQHLWNMHCKLN